MDAETTRELDTLRQRVAHLEARLHDVTRVVSTVYHDLSNPLSALTGNAELLRILGAENPIDAEMRDTIEDLALAANKLHAQMDDLRELRQALRTNAPL